MIVKLGIKEEKTLKPGWLSFWTTLSSLKFEINVACQLCPASMFQALSNNNTTSCAQQACINLGKTNCSTELQSQFQLALCFFVARKFTSRKVEQCSRQWLQPEVKPLVTMTCVDNLQRQLYKYFCRLFLFDFISWRYVMFTWKTCLCADRENRITHARQLVTFTQETNLGRLLKIADSQQRYMGPSFYIP